MYNDQLVYNVVIWVFFGISLCTDKVALTSNPVQSWQNIFQRRTFVYFFYFYVLRGSVKGNNHYKNVMEMVERKQQQQKRNVQTKHRNAFFMTIKNGSHVL